MNGFVTNADIAMLHYFNKKGWDELADKYWNHLIGGPMIAALAEQKEQTFQDLFHYGEAQVFCKYPMILDELTM